MGWFNDVAEVFEDAVEVVAAPFVAPFVAMAEAVDNATGNVFSTAVNALGDGLTTIGEGIVEAAETVGEGIVAGAEGFADGFDKDGWFTEFVQDNVPLGGFVTAIAHSAAGHNDYAELAATKGLATTVDFAVSAAATALGGPIAGGAVGGFLGPIIKGGINELGRTYFVDDDLKDELEPWDFDRVAMSAVMGAGIGAATGAAGGYIKAVGVKGGWVTDVSERAVYTNAAGEIIEEGAESAIITYAKAPLSSQVLRKIEDFAISKTLKAPLNEARSEILDLLPEEGTVAGQMGMQPGMPQEAGDLDDAMVFVGDVDGDGDVDEFDLELSGFASPEVGDADDAEPAGAWEFESEQDESDSAFGTPSEEQYFAGGSSTFDESTGTSITDAGPMADPEPMSDTAAPEPAAPPAPSEFDTRIEAVDALTEAADDVWDDL